MLRRHTPPTGTPAGNSLYDEVLTIMRRFVSPTMAESALRKAITECGGAPSTLEPAHLTVVIEHAMMALRLFCAPEKLSELMIVLAETCDKHRTGRA